MVEAERLTGIDMTTNYLDFYSILKYELVGNEWILIILGLLVLLYFCAKFELHSQTTLTICAIYGLIIAIININYTLYTLVLIMVGLTSYYLLSKLFSR